METNDLSTDERYMRMAIDQAYIAEEKAGVRSEALRQLDAFIASLRSQRESDWQSWAIDLSEEIVDLQNTRILQQQLF